MKRLLIIIFATIAILSVFAQGLYYNVGDKRVYLTIDSNTVVSFTSQNVTRSEAIPRHLTLVDSVYSDGLLLTIYNVSLPKSKFDLQNLKYFPTKLSITPCYRDLKGNLKIPNGHIIVKLKNEKDLDKLYDIATRMNLLIKGSPEIGSCYSLTVHPDKGIDPVQLANQLHTTGLFDFAYPSFFIDDCLEISHDTYVGIFRKWSTNCLAI